MLAEPGLNEKYVFIKTEFCTNKYILLCGKHLREQKK